MPDAVAPPRGAAAEPEVRFRRAGPEDADRVARLHHRCSGQQPGGFMHRLGLPFFRRYYRILLPDPNTLVLCAEAPSGQILGFVAGCSDAQAEMARLQRHRAGLLLACAGPLLKQPSLALDLWARKRYLDNSRPEGWGLAGEARISFWCWEPGSEASRQPTVLLRRFLECLRAAGARTVRLEVDRVNRKVEITQRLMGARTVGVVRTPDGGERLLMEHVLQAEEPGAQSTR